MKKLFLLSLMAMLLPLAALADGLTVKVLNEGGSVVYNGTDTKKALNIKVYAGEDETTPLTENTDYQLLYTEDVKDVKTGYIVKAIGINSYLGQNGETTFAVTKKPVKDKLTLNTVSKTYGEDDQTVLASLVTIPSGVLAIGDEAEDFLSCLMVARTSDDTGGDNAGKHFVLVKGNPDALSNYEYTAPDEGNYTTMTINKKPLHVALTEKRQGRDYNGKAFSPNALSKTTYYEFGKDEIVGEDEVEVSFSYEGDKINAGKKVLDVAITKGGDNYVIADDNETVYEIYKLDLTITAKTSGAVLAATYGDEIKSKDVTAQFDFDSFIEGEDATKNSLAMMWESAEPTPGAKKYDINPYLINEDKTYTLIEANKYDKALTNYNIVYEETAQFEISKKAWVQETDMPTVAIKNLTYQGHAFDLDEAETTVTYNKKTLTKGVDYTYEVTVLGATAEKDVVKNANEQFMVTIKAAENGNYSGEVIVIGEGETSGWTITKGELAISITEENAKQLTKVYDGKDYEGDDLTELYSITGFVGDDEVEGKSDAEKAAAIGLTMQKNPGKVVVVDNYLVHPAYNGKNIGSAAYTSDLSTDGLPNYKIKYDRTKYKFSITPRLVKYWIAESSKVYSGTKQTLTKGTIYYEVDKETEGEGFVNEDSFTTIDGAVAPNIAFASGVTAKDVNEEGYELVVTNVEEVSAGDNYEPKYVGEKDGKFYITPAKLTVKTLPKEINYGEELPEFDVKNTDYISFSGWKTADKETIYGMTEFKLDEEALAGKVGVYDIVAEVVEPEDKASDAHTIWNNYTYAYTYGKLTIKGEKKITLDWNATDESVKTQLAGYNGQEEMEVHITNRSLNADYWYTLVLPFDISLRDFSNAFGYAVVNVPNTENSDPSVISFNLYVKADDIPANTLIAFKTNQAVTAEDCDITFEGRTIKYDPDYATNGVYDRAGNYFRGVYEPTRLTEGTDWYLSAGEFINAATTASTIRSLSGYIYAVEAENARIFVEDADGTVTAINAINVDKVNNAEGWYTVGGVKLNAEPTQKGVYINNGKKVVIK